MTILFGAPDSKRLRKTKGLLDTLTGKSRPLSPSGRLGNQPTDEERAAHDAAYRTALDDIEKRKNTLWCHVAMVFESNSLILIRHKCVDQKDWVTIKKRRGFSKKSSTARKPWST